MADKEIIAILHYQDTEGRIPYRDWIDSLDKKAGATIAARINRIALGTFGDWKAVGEGVSELRVHLGPGYRVYFGRDGETVVILLCGGIKRSQASDIKQAKSNWRDYETRKKPAARRPAR